MLMFGNFKDYFLHMLVEFFGKRVVHFVLKHEESMLSSTC